jgi:uncharacterized membrane protein YccC
MSPSWAAWGRSAARYTVGVLITAAIVWVLVMPSEPAAWSVVALVVVLGATTGQSVTAAVNRMAGSVVGCLTGALVQVAMPWLWLPVRVAIAVLACMLICRLIRLTAGQRLGMALAGFFVFVPGDQEWQTVGWRLLATLIGITVALVIALVMWPSSARDRLIVGIDEVLGSIASSLRACGDRMAGTAASSLAEPTAPAVATLRPLVAERRFEPPGRGPSATALSGVLDGLDIAVVGVHRLEGCSAPGPQGLMQVLAPDLRAIIDSLVTACEGLRAVLTDPGASARHLGDVDAELSASLERLRAAHLTPAAQAGELRDLFAAVEALSLIASGLARVDAALGERVRG